MANCIKCGSKNIVSVSAKTSEVKIKMGKLSCEESIPGGLAIGHKDNIEFKYCPDCGFIQDEFPLGDMRKFFKE